MPTVFATPAGEKQTSADDREGLRLVKKMLLVLCRLRRGIDEEVLADRVGVKQSTISHIWTTWLPLLAERVGQLLIWATRDVVQDMMPDCFKQLFPNARVIVDCTELFIEMPSAYRAQSETFSHYKHHNTAKGLLGIAPHGAVTFVSNLYGGRQSDKKILLDCGLLEKLERRDLVLADRGFDCGDVLEERGLELVTPAFMSGRDQLPLADEVVTRRVASMRIHVERQIRRAKVYQLLRKVFPLKMKPSLNNIWRICVLLTNFLPPLVAAWKTQAKETLDGGETIAEKEPSRPAVDESALSGYVQPACVSPSTVIVM